MAKQKLIPLTKKELEPQVQAILDRLIVRFHLSDWKIYYTVSKKDSDCCADVRPIRGKDYKEAEITIYPKVIRTIQEDGYEEKLEEVLEHECLHLVVNDCFVTVDDAIVNDPQFCKAEELLIERMVGILNER